MRAKLQEQEEARRLRKRDGMPIKQIARRLGVSPGSVHLWTRDIVIAPEHAARNLASARSRFAATWSERNRERRRAAQREGRAWAARGDPLHLAGCMLYWGEGHKSRGDVRLTNSDPNLLAFFLRFMTECLGVEPERFTLSLHVYLDNGLTVEEIETYWLRALELPRSSLRKHMINPLPTSSSGKKRNKLPYGVCTLRLSDTHIAQHIYGAIQEYGSFEEPRWLDGPPIKRRPAKSRRSRASSPGRLPRPG